MTPIVHDKKLFSYDLYTEGSTFICDIEDDWDVWQNWLENRMQEKKASFRYECIEGWSCTVIREYRKHYGKKKKPVWYAHRRLGGALQRQYIGKSENCTREKLKAAALKLTSEGLKLKRRKK